MCKRCLNILNKEIRYSETYNKLIKRILQNLSYELPNQSNFAYINPLCHTCQSCDIEITSLSSNEARSKIEGLLRPTDEKFCNNCGNIRKRIPSLIPLHLDELKCLKCGENDYINYYDLKIKKMGQKYDFLLATKCNNCKDKGELRLNYLNEYLSDFSNNN